MRKFLETIYNQKSSDLNTSDLHPVSLSSNPMSCASNSVTLAN